ncbi:substrate-binding domain-containing protein [Actinocorallia longicatena]|uniref:Substrate-binding domain-containing protein n=1 Tax=Actinocorallia longicatena TaxID=111803 RepID=A0ABP6QCG5_9ACTN
MAAVLTTALLAGCSSGTTSGGPREGTLRVLAGSELADLRPILEQAKEATGVSVQLDFAGTLDGVQQVASGRASATYEAVWFSSNRYLGLHPGAQVGTATPIMKSPVVLGVRPEVAQRLGWTTERPTWAKIAEAAARRDFTYGMTSPAASNSGFSALVGIATALNPGSDLDPAGIERVAPKLKEFFGAQTLTAGSSGWLTDAFVRHGAEVDGLVNYESVLLSLNASGKLQQPLTLVYPADGVVTADYPLTLLGSAPSHARDSYAKLTAYLLKPEVQQRIADTVHRRPVTAGVAFAGEQGLKELPFPGALQTVDKLIAAFFDRLRRPARTLYVVDVSGSMTGQRIKDLKAALVSLTGADDKGFERFHNREQVTLIPFSSKTAPPQVFTIPETGPEPELLKIRSFAQGLNASGGTAIYDSLTTAFGIARQQTAKDPDRFTSIVLMTDGENANGMRFPEFESRYPSLAKGVPVFPILFGEAKEDEMNELARLTGGTAFDARKQPLETVFKEIRGYQ